MHNLCQEIYKSFSVIQEGIVRTASQNNQLVIACFPNIPDQIADTQKLQNNLLATNKAGGQRIKKHY